MNTLLLFIVPPIAGAIIAYTTNVIAIKMLFRPLREVRVLGIRLPFTPGILPRQRKKLAVSIGAMVERELLTPDILRRRLMLDEVREKILQSISYFTANILDKTPGQLSENIENYLKDRIPCTIEKVYPVFCNSVMDFIRRDDIRRQIESKGRIILRAIILKLSSLQRFFISAGQYDQTLEEKMPEIIDDLCLSLENLLNETNVKNTLIDTASKAIGNMVSDKSKTLREMLEIDEDYKKKLDTYLFEKLVTAADSQIENILATINIKALVTDRIDSLDMERVERIILDVMSDQFKWIHIFGGILGFFIGLFQATFTYLLR
ncbi:MAG: DUF445 family protein [Treponema sp.]|nr:DUF445 family protein [Treponema sp.]